MVAEVGTLEVEQRDEVTIVRLLGEHDFATAGELGRCWRMPWPEVAAPSSR